ncbi:MAG: hypothetical protein IT550_10920 [Novosphingobium sp.]|nr:hypothetical protein [Novosphingobium sp.]
MKALISLGALVLLAACAKTAPPVASEHSHASLVHAGIGQEVTVDGPRVVPLAVIEDSRCPESVQCVWSGQVRISIRIITGRGAETRDVTLGERIPVADGTLLLADVEPARTSEAAIPPGDYRFGFRFDGGY